MRNKKLQVWLPLILSVCMVAGMFIGYRLKGNMPTSGIFSLNRLQPIQEVIDLVANKYVDRENPDSLAGQAIETILAGLDPHSVLLPPRELKEANEDLEGEFYGIGIEFNIFDDTINVINVVPNGPSDKAGLMVGDKFLKAGDSTVAGNISADRIKALLRGTGGSNVNLTILRNGVQKVIGITRGFIPLYSMDAAYMIDDSVGYIRLNKFSETTYREFMQAMENLGKKGMTSLILDLRDNGGGILSKATDIADEFLSGDKLIAYTQGYHSPKKEYRCSKEGVFEAGKLVVLSNEGTASASEILMGALQDWDRATIMGRRSFGKGLVQEQYQLNDGSGLRLTVARYYTPLGRSIQKSYNGGTEEYNKDLMNRFQHGEMSFSDSIKHTNEKGFTTRSGKVVYAGGGITPDIFVPYDTLAIDKEITLALVKGTLNRFIYKNYLQNRGHFQTYKSAKEFDKSYSVDDGTLRSFQSFAEKDSLKFDLGDQQQKSLLKLQIKIMTARQIWRTQGLYEVSNSGDKTIQTALQFIGNRSLANLRK